MKGVFLNIGRKKHIKIKEGWGNFWLPCQKFWDNQGDYVFLTEEESVMVDPGKVEI